MADKSSQSGTGPPDADRPVPRRTWRHARYGDPPERAVSGAPQDKTFSEEDDAAATGDIRPHKH
jgi:hypothetical protein